jgi:hypothetical protein
VGELGRILAGGGPEGGAGDGWERKGFLFLKDIYNI